MRVKHYLKVLRQFRFKGQIQLMIKKVVETLLSKFSKYHHQIPYLLQQEAFVYSTLLQNGHSFYRQKKYSILKVNATSYFPAHAIAFRPHTSDLAVYNDIFFTQLYQPLVDLSQLWPQEQIAHIVDAGANIGCSSIWFAQLFPQAKVYAIEGLESNFSLLKQNIELNQTENIIPLEKALWINNQSLSFDLLEGADELWAAQVTEKEAHIENTEGITFEELMHQHHIDTIDILKMNIEGAEKYLFEDAQTVHFFLPKVKVLMVQVHEDIVSVNRLLNIIHGFNFEYIVRQKKSVIALNPSLLPRL